MKTFSKIVLIVLSAVALLLSGFCAYLTIMTFIAPLNIFAVLAYGIYAIIATGVNLIINLILIKKPEYRISLIITLASTAILIVCAICVFLIIPNV